MRERPTTMQIVAVRSPDDRLLRAACVTSQMRPTVCLVVDVIGWNPRGDEPRSLKPQFESPVRARIYTTIGIRHALAWLRMDGLRVYATLHLPGDVKPERMRCFCCTIREYEPRTRLERRRITSVDVVAEMCLEHEAEQPVQQDEHNDGRDASAADLLGTVAGDESAKEIAHDWWRRL